MKEIEQVRFSFRKIENEFKRSNQGSIRKFSIKYLSNDMNSIEDEDRGREMPCISLTRYIVLEY